MNRIGSDLRISLVSSLGNALSAITIDNHFASIKSVVDAILFDSGQTLSLTAGMTFQATGNETAINGTVFNDKLISGTANETMSGGLGNDTYLFRRSFGTDKVYDSGGLVDVLSFDTTILPENIRFTRGDSANSYASQNDLVARLVGSYGQLISTVVIADHFSTLDKRVEFAKFGNITVDLRYGLTIQGFNGQVNVNGTGENDRIIGNNTSETLRGGLGNDTYEMKRTAGVDRIIETGGRDSLQFDSSVTPEMLRLFRPTEYLSRNNLQVTVTDASGVVLSTITIVDHFKSTTSAVELLKLADGSVYSITDLLAPVNGTNAADRITGRISDTTINGLGGNDIITDLYGNNIIDGGQGDDTIGGGSGADMLVGAAGNDVLRGGTGNDTLNGGAGRDGLVGGAGNDSFVFTAVSDSILTAMDQITDFVRGQDKIDVSKLDALPAMLGIQDFSFIGSQAFHGIAGELRFANHRLEADMTGDRIADFIVYVAGPTTLTSSDFIF